MSAGTRGSCAENTTCTSRSWPIRWKTIYAGVTSALEARVWEHKTKALPGFTARYGIDRLVYFEHFTHVYDAIARERQIKGWTRAKKVALIASMNPGWTDLA